MSVLHQSIVLGGAEAFSDALGQFGWQGDFRQLKPGAEACDIAAAAGPGMTLLCVGLGSVIHQRAIPPAGAVTFGIPRGPQPAGRMGCRPLESETIQGFDAAGGIDVVSQPGFAAFTLSFDRHRLHAVASTLGFDDWRPTLVDGAEAVPDPAVLSALRLLLERVFAQLANPMEEGQSQKFWQDAEFAVQRLLLNAWEDGQPSSAAPLNARSRALRRALTYLDSVPHETPNVAQMCEAASCSVSTLERAFMEHFGVSPKRYTVAMRLSAVRRRLIDPGECRSIADVASEYGFWHMSKFAADYRCMFGELPSQSRAAA